jgi:DNA-directed RNA polymerase omega subunit
MDDRADSKVDSKFRFVLVAAQRAEQLMRGARPKVEAGKRKPTRVAMQEVDSNLVDWDYGPAPLPEPAAANAANAAAETSEAAEEVH